MSGLSRPALPGGAVADFGHAPAPTPDSLAGDPARVDGRRVGVFLAIVLGGALVVGLAARQGLAVLPPALTPALPVFLALVYMPLPLVAGLVVERMAGRRPLAVRAWRGVRERPRRLLGIAAAGILPMLAIVLVAFGVSWLLSTLGVPGAGELVTTQEQLADRLRELGAVLPADAASALPPVGVVAAMSLVQGVVAGATLNAVVAFGEEYGWRGVLAEELAPLGRLRSHLLIGVVWGVWHAPLIVWLGHNFGNDWALGVPMMVLMCVATGFVLAWVAARAGVFAAAVGHGVMNGTLGVVLLLFAGASPVVTVPGLALALGGALVAAALWSRGVGQSARP